MASASSDRAGGAAPTDTAPEISRILWRTDHWMHCYHNYSALVSLLTTNLSFVSHSPFARELSLVFTQRAFSWFGAVWSNRLPRFSTRQNTTALRLWQ